MISKDSIDAVTQIIAFKNRINTTIGLSFPNKSMSIWSDSLINNTIFKEYEAKYIIDETFIPFYKTEEYFRGTVEGLKEIIKRMTSNRQYK